jgi:hypothetical protein
LTSALILFFDGDGCSKRRLRQTAPWLASALAREQRFKTELRIGLRTLYPPTFFGILILAMTLSVSKNTDWIPVRAYPD